MIAKPGPEGWASAMQRRPSSSISPRAPSVGRWPKSKLDRLLALFELADKQGETFYESGQGKR